MLEGLNPSETELETEKEQAYTEEIRDGVWVPSIFDGFSDKVAVGASTKILKEVIGRPKAKVRITGKKERFDKSFGEEEDKIRSEKIEAGRVLISLLERIDPDADPKKIEKAGLEHGDNVVVMDEEHLKKTKAQRAKTLADGLITDLKGVPIMVAAADCAPIAMYDPENEAIGVFHSGWRGVVKQIALKGIKKMGENYGSKPEEVLVAIGPAADGENFEVGPEVLGEFKGIKNPDGSQFYTEEEINSFLKESRKNPGKYLLDSRLAIKISLVKSGVRPENIQVSGYSTMTKEGNQIFPSERLEGKEDRDSFILMMELKEK